MKILIAGSRNWDNEAIIHDVLSKLSKDTIIIHGNARGADTIAGNIAIKLGLRVFGFWAEWNKYGKAAGPIRNRKMLDEKPDKVIAFHNDINNSKGTKDCIKEAQKRGIEVEVVREEK